jgi:hypothetical protein
MALLRSIESQGWRCFTRRSRTVRVVGGSESGRRLSLIEPWDAYGVYVAAHRQPTGVFQMGMVYEETRPAPFRPASAVAQGRRRGRPRLKGG